MNEPRSRPLAPEDLRKMNAYWCTANSLSVGHNYLYDNPLLKEPLKLEHVKPRLLGRGHSAGFELHLSPSQPDHQEVYDLNVITVTGPGHGGSDPHHGSIP